MNPLKILIFFLALSLLIAIGASVNKDRQLELLTRDIESYNVETGVINYK